MCCLVNCCKLIAERLISAFCPKAEFEDCGSKKIQKVPNHMMWLHHHSLQAENYEMLEIQKARCAEMTLWLAMIDLWKTFDGLLSADITTGSDIGEMLCNISGLKFHVRPLFSWLWGTFVPNHNRSNKIWQTLMSSPVKLTDKNAITVRIAHGSFVINCKYHFLPFCKMKFIQIFLCSHKEPVQLYSHGWQSICLIMKIPNIGFAGVRVDPATLF